MDGSPADGTSTTYTVGRLGAISPPHKDALQHRGLRPTNLRRLLCDIIRTTVLLHKRHAVPILPLADHFSPLTGDPVNQSLANEHTPEWYHVANWTPTPGSSRWPAWDVILGLWLSGDLLLAPEVKSTIATWSKRSPYHVLYVYLESNQMPPGIRQEVDLEAHDVIILDGLGRHGLAPHFPEQRRLWAIHYGGNGRSLEAGLHGDVIPSWCAALHSAFSAILSAASQGPRTVFKDVQGIGSACPVALSPSVTRPRPHAPGPFRHSAQLSQTALLVWRRPKSGMMPRETHTFRHVDLGTLPRVDPVGMQIRSEFNLNSPNSLRIRSQSEFAANSA